MKKLSVLFLVILFGACDNGLIITIPASSSVSTIASASEVNAEPDNKFSGTKEVDINQLFSENAEQVESIKLERLTYELSDYTNTTGNVVLIDLTIQTELNGTTTDILNILGLVVANTGEILAYEDGNPTSVLSAAQVASLEAIMDNLEPFNFIITGDLTDDIDGDFTIELAYDISISVSQNTGD